MADEREALKGRLLNLWLQDLKNDRPPGIYPEVGTLSPTELEELMGLARFIKGNLYPSSSMPVNVDSFAAKLAHVVFQERKDQIEINQSFIKNAETFSQLVFHTLGSLRIDRANLQRSLTLPQATLSDLETEKMPPHRLPVKTMVRLLVALRLASAEIVNLIRKSSREWALRTYPAGQTQLGRIDPSLSNEERRNVMQDQGELNKEFEWIDSYCSRLHEELSTIWGNQDPKDLHLADGETWPHH